MKTTAEAPDFFIFFVCVFGQKNFCKIWVIFWSFFFFFKTLFPLEKTAFWRKVLFRPHWWNNKFLRKKSGCRIRNFSHFLCQKTTFFSNFWTLMVLGPKARKKKLDPFPKKLCDPPPNPTRKVFDFLKCDLRVDSQILILNLSALVPPRSETSANFWRTPA